MKEKSKSKSNFQLVLANFRFRAEWKKVTSRAEPSWKSFSSSYGSSQLGSDSSLEEMYFKMYSIIPLTWTSHHAYVGCFWQKVKFTYQKNIPLPLTIYNFCAVPL